MKTANIKIWPFGVFCISSRLGVVLVFIIAKGIKVLVTPLAWVGVAKIEDNTKKYKTTGSK